MSFVIKRIGFKDNKKCRLCENLAYFQLGKIYLCDIHMDGFMKFRGFK